MNETLLRLHNILNFPLVNRCDEIRYFIRDCGLKELQAVFPLLLDHMFGTGNRTGWGFCNIIAAVAPREYSSLTLLLNSKGAIFDLIYRLMSDCYLKYEFPFSLIPLNVRKAFEEDIPSFYLDKVQIDQQTRMLTSLALNPFEFYMFHFALHLVNPWVARTASQQGDTVYSTLVEDYLSSFLPCDGSPVCPPVDYYVVKAPLPRPQAVSTPLRTPTLFRQAMLTKQAPSTLHTPPAAQPTPHMEVWRTETVIQAFTDMWLTYCANEVNGMACVRELPSVERLRVVRLMLKHLHYFANSAHQDLSPMGEVKSSVRPLTHHKVYKFLRRTIRDWPLDGSFRIVLETWLSYIQPWRYVGYNRPSIRSSVVDEAPRVVDASWVDFVLENLFAYTVIFQQLIPRFARLDLTTPRNAHMLHRLSKVFSQTNLNMMIAEGEAFLGGPVPPQLQGVHGQRYLHQNAAKWTAVLRQQMQELEGTHFEYTYIFDDSTNKVSELLQLVLEAAVAARVLTQAEEQARVRAPPTFSSWLRDIFMGAPQENQFSAEERRKVVAYLDMSLEGLAAFFVVPTPTIPEVSSMSLQDVSALMRHDSGTFYQLVSNSLVEPESSRQRNLQGLRNRQSCLRYEGDPDLQPVRSSELSVLVWLFYNIGSKLNQIYGDEMTRLFYREDFVGRIARQILSPPLIIRTYDKRAGVRYAPLVEKVLPPRLSLRPLASTFSLTRFLVFAFILWLWGFGPISIMCVALALYALWVLIRATLEPVLTSISAHDSSSSPPPMNISDVSERDVSASF